MDLYELKIVKIDKEHKFGKNSTFYKLTDNFETIAVIPVSVENTLIKKIIQDRNESFEAFKFTVEGQLYLSYISNLYITNINDAYVSINSMYLLPIGVGILNYETIKKQKTILRRIQDKDIFLTRKNNEGRVVCNFSVLHRNLRQYLEFEGKTLKCVDLKNSQPLLAGMYIKSEMMKDGEVIPQELEDYIELCSKGKFYETFMSGKEYCSDCRKYFKQEFFGDVFFSKVKVKHTKLAKMFIERFPFIYQKICEFKGGYNSGTHKDFAINMQNFESNIVFDKINLPMLREGYGCFNIYDSIVSHSNEVLEEATKRINYEFSQFGVTPSLTIEDFQSYGEEVKQGCTCGCNLVEMATQRKIKSDRHKKFLNSKNKNERS